MRILILAAGTRNMIVRYFKEALRGDGAVFAADADPLAPALYEADGRYIVPAVREKGYIGCVLSICEKESVDGVLSLIDPDLSVLAANEDRFRTVGTTVIGSSFSSCEMAMDKYQTYLWLARRRYPCARSWRDLPSFDAALAKREAAFPVLVKPARGSASAGIYRVCDRESLELLFRRRDGLILQEYLRGQEIGADIYVDLLSGKVVSIFTKKKLRMRAGETDKSVSFKDPALFSLIERFVTEAGFRGPVDIDLFEVDGQYYISEVNPRFGGGYPHAHVCGCDFPQLILNNLNGIVNEPHIGDYEEGVCMMKFSEVTIRKETELAT